MSTKSDIPLRPGLTRVKPVDLIKGKTYLVEGPFDHFSTPYRLKCVFKKNRLPTNRYQCTMTSFTDLNGAKTLKNLELQSSYYRYYEQDAAKRALIKQALRNITGDPDFVYNPSRKPSASIHTVAPDHPRMSWIKEAALEAAEHKALEKRIDAADGKLGGKPIHSRRRRGRRSLKNKNRRNYSKRRY